MSEEKRLLTCPFCGGEAVRISFLDNRSKGTRYIGCKKCGVVSFKVMTNAQAMAAWNTRTKERQ
jgi:Lar family restriction alleviation protein